MADNTSQYTLNLDAEQFTAAANQAASALTGIGEAGEAIGALVDTLEHVGLALGVITVAFLGLEKIIESVFESEKIRQTEQQFNALSKAAGVYSDTLKKGLESASGGWATDTELMQHANKAMSELEVGVEKLPELMDAAKRATAVMGGEFLQNFDAMSQAVASGNTRQLRHLGIIIDQEKAYRDYARSIGVTVDTLSLAGKQQAIMDALLAQTSEKFKNVNGDLIQNTSLAKQFSATWKEISEIVTVVMGKFASPVISAALESMTYRAKQLKTYLQDMFGSGAEKNEAHLTRTKEKVQELYKEVQRLQAEIHKTNDPMQLEGYQRALDRTREKYNQATAELKKTEEAEKSLAKTREQTSDQSTKKSLADIDKVQKQRAEAAKESAALDRQTAAIERQNTQEEIKEMESVDEATKLYNKQRVQNVQETEAKITQIKAEQAQIRAKYAEGKLTQAQEVEQLKKTDQQIVQLNKLKDHQMAQDDAELARMQSQALDNYQDHSENVFEGVGRSFENMSKKNQMAMHDWGAFGTMTTDAFATHATGSIAAWGAGTEKATDAVKGMFAGMAGDIAMKYGEVMMLAGIWPPNPAAIAGGAALIALGGYLSSLGGAKTTAGTGSYGGGGGGNYGLTGGSASNPSSSTPLPSSAGQQTRNGPSNVHITVQGSIFDTQATQTRIADLVRNAQDSTDFSIQKVGGGV